MRLETWVPVLPSRVLSPNGGQRSRRNPWEVANGKLELGDAVFHAVREAHGPTLPKLTPVVRLTLIAYIKHHARPKIPDGYYRTRDVPNLGGDVLKPICDAFIRLEVIEDDDYRWVRPVILDMVHVDTLEEEGLLVVLDEMGEMA